MLQQNFSADAPNQKWASNITYLWTAERWPYLAVIIDLFSRMVVGWTLAERMTAETQQHTVCPHKICSSITWQALL
ncbi:DDE-type integrase/transposase/recombinase [Desulfobulbus oligotrophicus]|jgi:transposase InsO family protein|uniref:DDE-type integrase/transposase/recombinase n=1 Tax=Desulfobulbus oligotrophicus TaxID=1909699 RepID=A0A7T5VEB6_9BACT|nr:DDE-type integrase/transposase/recombinase [Desulfobulbus oligotrophicus]